MTEIVRDASGKPLDKSNVFYDTFPEVKAYYASEVTEVWESALTIVMSNTGRDTGLFPKSDIIIVYNKADLKPLIVTERIFKKNYSYWDWRRVKAILKRTVRVLKHDLGFNLSISVARNYIDYVHYKEDWMALCIAKRV